MTETEEEKSSQVTPKTWLEVCSPTKDPKEVPDFMDIFRTTHPQMNPLPKEEPYEHTFFPDCKRIAEDFLSKKKMNSTESR